MFSPAIVRVVISPALYSLILCMLTLVFRHRLKENSCKLLQFFLYVGPFFTVTPINSSPLSLPELLSVSPHLARPTCSAWGPLPYTVVQKVPWQKAWVIIGLTSFASLLLDLSPVLSVV